MRIAVPIANGKLCLHFGHCEQFAFIDVDAKENKILQRKDVTPPPHEPGLFPRWLREQEVSTVLAGGMGVRARDLLAEQNIKVLVGAPPEPPEELVSAFLTGILKTGKNTCDH